MTEASKAGPSPKQKPRPGNGAAATPAQAGNQGGSPKGNGKGMKGAGKGKDRAGLRES